jgi:hypothetical protein
MPCRHQHIRPQTAKGSDLEWRISPPLPIRISACRPANPLPVKPRHLLNNGILRVHDSMSPGVRELQKTLRSNRKLQVFIFNNSSQASAIIRIPCDRKDDAMRFYVGTSQSHIPVLGDISGIEFEVSLGIPGSNLNVDRIGSEQIRIT